MGFVEELWLGLSAVLRELAIGTCIILVTKIFKEVVYLQIILMSATIDAIKFAQYFATPVMGHLLPAPIVSAGENTIHKVQIFYLESLSVICKERPVSI